MSFVEWSLESLVVFGLALPFALLAVLAAASLSGRALREAVTGRLAPLAFGGSLLAFVAAWPPLLAVPGQEIAISTTSVFAIEATAFRIVLLVDPLSLWLATLTSGICAVIAAFSHRYLHREPGYNRFFVLLAVFAGGLLLVAFAASVEVLFAGWEMVGVSSALLAGFFHERPAPLRNAMHVFTVYRFGDAAMLAAAVLVHHYLGTGSLAVLFDDAASGPALSAGQATVVGALLLVAAAAKCAQLPFSNWLPRAMEGPTPSSAVLYGALSVHAGAYLLLRASPILERSPAVAAALAVLGTSTAIYATLAGRVQTDVKSALAFASLTQVSIILVEIALGLGWLAAVHMTGHACVRVLQFLRAPSVLHELHEAENAVGAHLGPPGALRLPPKPRWALYRFALERGYLEGWLMRFFVRPFAALFGALSTLDRRICDRISGTGGGGGPTRATEALPAPAVKDPHA